MRKSKKTRQRDAGSGDYSPRKTLLWVTKGCSTKTTKEDSVKTIENFLKHLNPKLDCLFQRPTELSGKFKPKNETIWYCNAPVGESTLANITKCKHFIRSQCGGKTNQGNDRPQVRHLNWIVQCRCKENASKTLAETASSSRKMHMVATMTSWHTMKPPQSILLEKPASPRLNGKQHWTVLEQMMLYLQHPKQKVENQWHRLVLEQAAWYQQVRWNDENAIYCSETPSRVNQPLSGYPP